MVRRDDDEQLTSCLINLIYGSSWLKCFMAAGPGCSCSPGPPLLLMPQRALHSSTLLAAALCLVPRCSWCRGAPCTPPRSWLQLCPAAPAAEARPADLHAPACSSSPGPPLLLMPCTPRRAWLQLFAWPATAKLLLRLAAASWPTAPSTRVPLPHTSPTPPPHRSQYIFLFQAQRSQTPSTPVGASEIGNQPCSEGP